MFGKSKDLLGIICEHSRLSLTLVSNGEIKRSLYVNVPDNILDGSDIVSTNLLAAFIKDTLKANKINCKDVAYALPGEEVFIRNISMPEMEEEQIRFNIPFEFRDFINGELNTYIFDYAFLPDDGASMDESTGQETMHLVAAAVSVEYLERIRNMLKLAGLKLVKATPEIFTFEQLLGKLPDDEERNKERCFLDIGSGTSRMIVFKNGRYKLTHMIDIGSKKMIQTLADEMNVDMHLATTYLQTNYQDCRNLPALVNVYKDISLEILKGLNFYEVSDMSSRLKDVVLCGTGAMIEPLVDLLKERITMNVVTMNELLPEYVEEDGAFNITAPSFGLALGDE